jgi:hypothetical protein
MLNTYRYNHRTKKLRVGLLVVSFLFGIGGILLAGFFVYSDLQNNQAEVIEGESRTVAQVLSDSDAFFVNEPDFDFELPNDWREIDRVDSPNEQSITWQATLKDEDNRFLKLYINTIPQDPVVRLLPVSVNGSRLQRGQLSPNCSSFTGSETTDRDERRGQPPTQTKWANTDFICDVGRIVNENIIGTGQSGEPINTITVTGEESGTNQYFFLYEDRNVRPNFDILYNAVNTFFAK